MNKRIKKKQFRQALKAAVSMCYNMEVVDEHKVVVFQVDPHKRGINNTQLHQIFEIFNRNGVNAIGIPKYNNADVNIMNVETAITAVENTLAYLKAKRKELKPTEEEDE